MAHNTVQINSFVRDLAAMPPALALVSSVDPSAFAGAGVWRADQLASSAGSVLSSGHPALDAQLPGGGWPVGALTELLQLQSGAGEWGLLLPVLAQLLPSRTARAQGRAEAGGASGQRAPQPANGGVVATPTCVVLVGAPHVPLGPALQARGLDAQRLLWVRTDAPAARAWACEQALRCADVAAVLAWLPQVRADALRRLHLAAHDHAKLLWVLRPAQAQHESSPAPLRLLLESAVQVLGSPHESRVSILKRRGPPLQQAVPLCLHSAALQALLAAAQVRAALAKAETEPPSLRAQRGNPCRWLATMDCHVAVAPCSDEALATGGSHALDRLAAAV
jgi:protein ImuA